MRVAKFVEVDAQVMLPDGSLVTRRVAGPSTHSGWEDCWSFYSSAMVSLGVCGIGPLELYAKGIRKLVTKHQLVSGTRK